jgi:hypothetical protein
MVIESRSTLFSSVPAARDLAVMAMLESAVVLFGGVSDGSSLNDT